jgi:hypothetical protein
MATGACGLLKSANRLKQQPDPVFPLRRQTQEEQSPQAPDTQWRSIVMARPALATIDDGCPFNALRRLRE